VNISVTIVSVYMCYVIKFHSGVQLHDHGVCMCNQVFCPVKPGPLRPRDQISGCTDPGEI
jgi:hypothetical protein